MAGLIHKNCAIRPKQQYHRPSLCAGQQAMVNVEGEKKEMLNPTMEDHEEAFETKEPEGENIVGIPEARVPRTIASPTLPSTAEVEAHNLTHTPYQSWCPVCVEAQGKEDAHKRDGAKEDNEIAVPTMGNVGIARVRGDLVG